MSVTTEQIQNALRELVDPVTDENFIDSKQVKNIKIEGSMVSLEIVLPYPGKSVTEGIRKQVVDRLKKIDGVQNVSANVFSKIVSHSAQRGVKLIPGIKNIGKNKQIIKNCEDLALGDELIDYRLPQFKQELVVDNNVKYDDYVPLDKNANDIGLFKIL